MTHPRPPMLRLASLLLALAACSSGSGGQDRPDAPPAPDAPGAPTDAPPAVSVDDATARAADAICGALFRCCDDDLTDYFAGYRGDERLAAFRDRLPPTATLDEPGCRAVVKDMLEVVYLGEWVRAVRAGQVGFDGAAFGACVATLDGAACGAPAREALWDSTCFGLAPPGGGSEQRSFVDRTRGVGEACAPVRDGIGSVFYGSCDPDVAFCCYTAPDRPGCQFPFDSAGNARAGTCQAVAADGQACSSAAPIKLCATGHSCDADTERCIPPATGTLAVGATCADASYNLLGTCVDSWCDVLGTKTCTALRDEGATCGGGEECRSGLCQTTCQPNNICTGTTPPPVDAGVPDAAIDAMPIDAMPIDAPAATGETCTTALDLLGSSMMSPAAGYTHRVQAGFGESNDYNPLSSQALPPRCSVVYDARGKDKVYAITLNGGDRLELRAELTDGRQAGLYLLDTCPEGSWTDFDGTGACGSNEYNAGFCGPVGCDPARLNIVYPATIGGQPSPPATFWVVVDQVGGDASTGFTLDWKRTTL